MFKWDVKEQDRRNLSDTSFNQGYVVTALFHRCKSAVSPAAMICCNSTKNKILAKKKKKSRCPHRYFSAKASFELTSPVPCWLINTGCPSGWSRSAYLTFLRFPASSKITSGTVTSKNVNNFQNTRPLQSGMLVQLKLLHYRFKHLYRFR